MPDPSFYEGREQTLVKHYILGEYLEKFAHIIGWHWQTVAYVDCFSGPWEPQDPALSDTSFAIAVDAFRKAKEDLAVHGKHPRIRCLFLEKDDAAFARLSMFAAAVTDVEAVAVPGQFEDRLPQILKFIRESGSGTFSFIFIDPTGWTGFTLDVITQLLKVRPGEVLINFMTHHIRRFILLEESAESFVRLFGEDIRHELTGLDSQEREEKLVGAYMRRLKERGEFTYVGSAIVWKPVAETTHFHLIYATRHDRGIEEFKKVEKAAMHVAESARAAAKERKRMSRSQQTTFLQPHEQHLSVSMTALRTRYLDMARRRVRELLEGDGEVTYRRLWRRAVAFPLVWEDDLRAWIHEWRAANLLDLPGLTARQQPTRKRDDRVVWKGRR
jgi:three-Cys-motif partner protein